MTPRSQKTMRAVVWEGKPYHMVVKDVPRPQIVEEDDVIVRMTTAAICGTDLHVYHGISGSTRAPWTMGHEGIGVITELGSAVQRLKIGDRVIVQALPDDGALNIRPDLPQLHAHGLGDDFGGLGGCQAEYVRVPEGDLSCIPVPAGNFEDKDFLFLSDIFSTAWIGLDFAGFEAGDSVAVFGAGPVGLLCVYSAFLRGASKVYSIDHVADRLEKAASIGAIPINFRNHPASEQLLTREPGGVIRSVDCCGYECVNDNLKPQQNFILEEAIKITARGGGIGVPGVYLAQPSSEGKPNAGTVAPEITFPITALWIKGIRLQGGVADPKLASDKLVQLVKNGRAKPGFVVSAEVGIEEAPRFYERFDQYLETKVLIKFPWEDNKNNESTLEAGADAEE